MPPRAPAPTSALLCAALLAACSGAPTTADGPSPGPTRTTRATAPAPGTQVGIPDPDTIDPARLDPLAGMPACPSPPAPAADADPGEVPLPPDAVVTQASVDGPLRSVQGWVPRTPVEVMVDYLRRDGIEVAAAEDEVFESEVLLVAEELRVFVKAQASCARGSAFVLFSSDDPELVPVPAGTGP